MTRDGRSMTLDQFSDEDLGPGGRFITRWGDDPIRPAHDAANALRHRTFIPPSAFRDVLVAGEGGFEAEVVESVRMPVRLGKPAKSAPGDPGAKPDTFMDVSLVTYVPRFDIETEQWYVDLAIDHPLEAEPFLRLGLVRYQPHAPEELQLSYPVVQWTQLLPERSVEVSVTATTTPKTHSRTVAITVQGVRTVPPLTAKTSTQDDRNPEFWEQVMTACIVREYVSEAGLSCRTLLQPMTPMQTQPGAPGQDAWQHAGIDFSVDPLLDKTQQAKYSVYIEEFERRLPATYPAEPVSPEILGQPAFSIPSGPRFAARVDL